MPRGKNAPRKNSPTNHWSVVHFHHLDRKRTFIEGQWVCNCTCSNLMTRPDCMLCHKSRPRLTCDKTVPEYGRISDTHAGDWKCKRCDAIMKASCEECVTCKEAREDTPPMIRLGKPMHMTCGGDWFCGFCYVIMDADAMKCAMCHKTFFLCNPVVMSGECSES